MIDPDGCGLGCFPTLPIRTPSRPRAGLGPRIERSAGSTPVLSGRSAGFTPAFPGRSAGSTPAFPGRSAGSTPAFPGRSAGSTPALPGRSAGSTPARRLLFVGGAK
ncbi:hypothetical protein CH301_08510 [Rhodococcus sp. 15-1189-1-1a]|nr:hypothetical protein CH301_08510 [Rhodococcus sp. 15-1189-1-1a]